uniref:Large ribosomal subunit protein mL40 n=1 Tax=Tetraselmis sp. GSL018 TaxID=582737 RepID=A0A061QYZ7_9CHLO|mmetsp:Transcript_13546/g.32083  ORF Transcript_13546/g.32083 Transcript_13546/m.32083 type:complete len:194 (-) Transcript_13546:330-911(-)
MSSVRAIISATGRAMRTSSVVETTGCEKVFRIPTGLVRSEDLWCCLLPSTSIPLWNCIRGAKASAAKKTAQKKAAREVTEAPVSGKLQTLFKALIPEEIPKTELSVEELEEYKRIAKNFSRMKMKQHREWQQRMTTKIKLKLAAIEALPPELQEHARTPDYADFPPERWIPTHTPPIEGYSEHQGGDWSQRRR